MKIQTYILKKIVFILFALLLFSCEQATNVEIEPKESVPLVVECILTSEYKFQTVKLTELFFKIDTFPAGISNATVKILSIENTYSFTESSDSSGLYVSNQAFAANFDVVYELFIVHEADTFFARANLIPATPIKTIPYTKSRNTDSLYMLMQNFETNEEAMWEVEMDWSEIEYYKDKKNKALTYLYSFKTIDVNQVFAPNKELIEFPKGTMIRVKKYSLTPSHAAFYRAVLSEVEWSGGFFDVAPANTPSNFSDGVVGYFGVCTVLKDSILVE